MSLRSLALLGVAVLALAGCGSPAQHADPLPSWNAGAARERLVAFVDSVTRAGSPDYVPPADRIAVFDNDGTLWVEQPMYAQLHFAVDRLKALAPEHPEWQDDAALKAAISGDFHALGASGHEGILKVIAASHAGMSTDEFDAIARAWIRDARHPKFDRPYTALVYQPMLELLAYLRSKGFKTWIVSGGGIDFMRPWTEAVYGIPPEQVLGSQVKTSYRSDGDRPQIQREPAVHFIDDQAGKPIGIQRHIGRRPILAVGNSDGDFEMLEWSSTGPGPRLAVLVHHTDAEREYAYDRESHVGRLARGLDEAAGRGWLVVDMAKDWATMFPAAR